VVSDTIYLGEEAPLEELGLHLASSASDRVTIYGLDGGGLPCVQFSQNWLADDTYETFHLWWGNGERVDDSDAIGGTAFRLRPGDGESFAWVWTTDFFKEVPFVAYFRLKVSDNVSAGEVARISIKGGGTEYGPLSLKGTDFPIPNAYREFPIPFIFHDNPDDPFLIFNFWRSGQADVYVDAVYIFTSPQPVQSPFTWHLPGGNYRGGGIWVRYTDGAEAFSAIQEARLIPLRMAVSPTSLLFLAEAGAPSPSPCHLHVIREGCEPFSWTATSDAPWLTTQTTAEGVQVGVETTGLAVGTYRATVTVEAPVDEGSPALIPVTLIVAERLNRMYLPLVVRGAP